MTTVITAGKIERARKNRADLRRLLRENQPEFLAALQLVERHVDGELSGESPQGDARGAWPGSTSQLP